MGISQLVLNIIFAGGRVHRQQFRIFELARVFLRAAASHAPVDTADDAEQLPQQPHHVAGAFVGADAATLFLEAKAVLERLDRNVQVSPLAFSDADAVSVNAAGWADPLARLAITSNGKTIGVLAAASARTKRKAGIRRAEVVLFELDVDALTPLVSRHNTFELSPTYPQVEYDISMIVASSVRWFDAFEIASHADPLVRAVTFVDQYLGPQVPPGHKSLTLRLHLGSDEGTLVREQIDEIAGRVIAALTIRFNAVIRVE